MMLAEGEKKIDVRVFVIPQHSQAGAENNFFSHALTVMKNLSPPHNSSQ